MKLIKLILILSLFFHSNTLADTNIEFEKWKKNFKKIALENNISEATFDLVMSNTKFLPDVSALMKAELEKLAEMKPISSDLFEVVSTGLKK